MLKGFDNEPVYHEKYLKTKIKSYGKQIQISIIMEYLKRLRIMLVYEIKRTKLK